MKRSIQELPALRQTRPRLRAAGNMSLPSTPNVAYDQQGMIFAVSADQGQIRLFDSRNYAA